MGKKKWMMSTGGRTKSNGQERKMSGRTIYVQLARVEEICPMDKRGRNMSNGQERKKITMSNGQERKDYACHLTLGQVHACA